MSTHHFFSIHDENFMISKYRNFPVSMSGVGLQHYHNTYEIFYLADGDRYYHIEHLGVRSIVPLDSIGLDLLHESFEVRIRMKHHIRVIGIHGPIIACIHSADKVELQVGMCRPILEQAYYFAFLPVLELYFLSDRRSRTTNRHSHVSGDGYIRILPRCHVLVAFYPSDTEDVQSFGTDGCQGRSVGQWRSVDTRP